MRFQSRIEALHLLGLESGATDEQIKMVYHGLIKQYHPDENPDGEILRQFYDIRDAYEYLMTVKEQVFEIQEGNRMYRAPQIFGSKKDLEQASFSRKIREENAKKEKRRQQAIREKKKKLEQQAAERRRIEEENRKWKEKQEQEYKEAMDKINAIRTARAIEAILNYYKAEDE